MRARARARVCARERERERERERGVLSPGIRYGKLKATLGK